MNQKDKALAGFSSNYATFMGFEIGIPWAIAILSVFILILFSKLAIDRDYIAKYIYLSRGPSRIDF